MPSPVLLATVKKVKGKNVPIHRVINEIDPLVFLSKLNMLFFEMMDNLVATNTMQPYDYKH